MNHSPHPGFDWKGHIIECLDTTQYMSLGTHGADGAWVCPVYFAYDKNFHFYFISQPESKHMKNLEANPRIAIAIYSTTQEPPGDVRGIQLEADAKPVTLAEAAHAHATYFTATHARRPVKPDYTPPEYVKPDAAWRLVKAVPRRMFYFDTRFFHDNRMEVPEETFTTQ